MRGSDPDALASPKEWPPVLLVHGTFGSASLMSPWVTYFQAAGFEAQALSLPGREPTDHKALRRLGVGDYLASLLETYDELDRPPVVVGHSMGGLLAQQLAAERDCAAVVLVGSVPPGVLWAQPRAVPHLLRLLPRILAGRPLTPSPSTLRAVVFNDLSTSEQRRTIPRLVPDSGRAFRSLIFGAVRVPRHRVRCPVLCVSGGADRNVSPRISRAIASRYGAEHHVHPERGHWLIATSGVNEVAGPIVSWLKTTLEPTVRMSTRPPCQPIGRR